jgi:hypothetical protein
MRWSNDVELCSHTVPTIELCYANLSLTYSPRNPALSGDPQVHSYFVMHLAVMLL